MTYQRFEDLPVWKAAIALAKKAYELTDGAKAEFQNKASLKSQLERAALSVSNNIAEGFERGTTNELLSFLYIARGSAGEVRSMLCLMEQLEGLSNFKSQISNLKSQAESCSRQLRGWAEKLQQSGIKGQRHLNQASRIEYLREHESKRQEADKAELLKEIEEYAKQSRGF